ncbi:MAG: hypothetical protein HY610_03155 [Elusimicrobia bacterium]|nr:hypothetical protein [Elusimicrobiota bacterium]
MEDQLEFLPKIPRQYKISKVIKRNGQVVQFDPEKITNAIFKAAVEAQGSNRQLSVQLTEKAIRMLQQTCPSHSLPTVEENQDNI